MFPRAAAFLASTNSHCFSRDSQVLSLAIPEATLISKLSSSNMPSDEIDLTGIEYYTIPNFKFHSGTTQSVRVAYRSFNPTCSKTVCIPTCYGGRINSTLNYVSPPCTTLRDHHVVVVAMLGNGESSSPSNDDGFPKKLHYQDCINSQYELLTKHLGIKELEAVIGFSMAGQQAYYWAVMYPTFMKCAIPICGSARTSPHNWAFLEGPKGALINSVDYEDGKYRTKGASYKPLRGLGAFGRAYCAWALSAPWFRAELWRMDGKYDTVAAFMTSEWEPAMQSWDPEDLLILARMWQAGDVGSCIDGGDYTKALEGIQAKMLVMPSRTDQYFT